MILVVEVPRNGLVVDADPLRIAQVISNLLTNAAKYTEPGGRLVVSAQAREGNAELWIADNGIGISEEMLPHVFELFTQERQAIDRARGGLGLGLAIVKNLMTMHSGSVTASSKGRDVGSTHFETGGFQPAGWMRVLSDRRLVPVLQMMHGDPGRAWQLRELAEAASMSRATFAAYFKTVAGMSPLSYLTKWRMHLAQRALLESRTPVNVLARSLGYTSESAFSNAFRRVVGRSPKDFRTQGATEVATEREVEIR